MVFIFKHAIKTKNSEKGLHIQTITILLKN
jgi:hypothetical protein